MDFFVWMRSRYLELWRAGPEDVSAWTRELGPLTSTERRRGCEALRHRQSPYPPNAFEFVQLCRAVRRSEDVPRRPRIARGGPFPMVLFARYMRRQIPRHAVPGLRRDDGEADLGELEKWRAGEWEDWGEGSQPSPMDKALKISDIIGGSR